jgi:hypothetical protein
MKDPKFINAIVGVSLTVIILRLGGFRGRAKRDCFEIARVLGHLLLRYPSQDTNVEVVM